MGDATQIFINVTVLALVMFVWVNMDAKVSSELSAIRDHIQDVKESLDKDNKEPFPVAAYEASAQGEGFQDLKVAADEVRQFQNGRETCFCIPSAKLGSSGPAEEAHRDDEKVSVSPNDARSLLGMIEDVSDPPSDIEGYMLENYTPYSAEA